MSMGREMINYTEIVLVYVCTLMGTVFSKKVSVVLKTFLIARKLSLCKSLSLF